VEKGSILKCEDQCGGFNHVGYLRFEQINCFAELRSNLLFAGSDFILMPKSGKMTLSETSQLQSAGHLSSTFTHSL